MLYDGCTSTHITEEELKTQNPSDCFRGHSGSLVCVWTLSKYVFTVLLKTNRTIPRISDPTGHSSELAHSLGQ